MTTFTVPWSTVENGKDISGVPPTDCGSWSRRYPTFVLSYIRSPMTDAPGNRERSFQGGRGGWGSLSGEFVRRAGYRRSKHPLKARAPDPMSEPEREPHASRPRNEANGARPHVSPPLAVP